MNTDRTYKRTYVALKSIIGLACLTFAVYSFLQYIKLGTIVNTTSPITYRFVKAATHSGGRGSHYDATISFNDKEYEVNSTGAMNADLEKGKKPLLYYVEEDDKIISDWDVKLKFRLLLLAFFGFVIFTTAIFLSQKLESNMWGNTYI